MSIHEDSITDCGAQQASSPLVQPQKWARNVLGLTPVVRAHIVAALKLAAKTQREYERRVQHFQIDSGQVGAWEEIAAAIESGDYL